MNKVFSFTIVIPIYNEGGSIKKSKIKYIEKVKVNGDVCTTHENIKN